MVLPIMLICYMFYLWQKLTGLQTQAKLAYSTICHSLLILFGHARRFHRYFSLASIWHQVLGINKKREKKTFNPLVDFSSPLQILVNGKFNFEKHIHCCFGNWVTPTMIGKWLKISQLIMFSRQIRYYAYLSTIPFNSC